MDIKLNWLKIKNFKGIKDLLIKADGNNLNIYGDNATNKTSTIDGVHWVLFDKDSNDKADTNFTIKPQDLLGQDINHLETLVEAELLIDGQPLKIKKTREEKWVTRHGESEKTFDGHTKFYWFNEVPMKANPYKAKIDELINENIFKMITNPLYFNTKLTWQERREILLQISGDMTNEQVIASDESLSNLIELLNGRSIDDYKLVLADQLKGYKKERDNIPPRIDELVRSLPQQEPDYTLTQDQLKVYKDELATIEFLMTNAANKTNELNKKHQELHSLKAKLEETKANIKLELGSDKQKLSDKHQELNNGRVVLKNNIQALETEIESHKQNIEHGEKELIRLREEYTNLNNEKAELMAQQFEDKAVGVTTDCPTCKQKLPIEMIQGEMAELKANFESAKQTKYDISNELIKRNITSGTSIKETVEKNKQYKELLEVELSEKSVKFKEILGSIVDIEKQLLEPVAEPDYTKYPEIEVFVESILQLQAELDKPIEDKSSEFLKNKLNVQLKIDELNKILNGKAETEKKKTRIEELKAEEKRVSTLIAELEGNKYLLEKFIVAKVNLLEDSINNQFKHVKFKLFEENITNEGIKETCIALVNTNGSYIKFEDANSAGKINAGIDILNSLSKFYGVSSPIFIDNAESVTDLADTDSQVIRLVKPEIRDEEDRKKYSQLVMEVVE